MKLYLVTLTLITVYDTWSLAYLSVLHSWLTEATNEVAIKTRHNNKEQKNIHQTEHSRNKTFKGDWLKKRKKEAKLSGEIEL